METLSGLCHSVPKREGGPVLSLFCLHCLDNEFDGAARRAEARPAHLQWAAGLGPIVRMAGPLLDSDGKMLPGSGRTLHGSDDEVREAVGRPDNKGSGRDRSEECEEGLFVFLAGRGGHERLFDLLEGNRCLPWVYM